MYSVSSLIRKAFIFYCKYNLPDLLSLYSLKYKDLNISSGKSREWLTFKFDCLFGINQSCYSCWSTCGCVPKDEPDGRDSHANPKREGEKREGKEIPKGWVISRLSRGRVSYGWFTQANNLFPCDARRTTSSYANCTRYEWGIYRRHDIERINVEFVNE